MLIDIDEWGQVAVINMLVRYARTQFLDPNKVPVSVPTDYPIGLTWQTPALQFSYHTSIDVV